jgi:hypothetical protein
VIWNPSETQEGIITYLLALNPNAQVSSTCSPSLSSFPALRKKTSRALLQRTHTLSTRFQFLKHEDTRVGGKSCPFHCIALVYIHPTCTNYGTCLPTLVHGIHHLLPTMDDAKLPTIVLEMAYCHTCCSFRVGQQS